jgi:hypothetical protein
MMVFLSGAKTSTELIDLIADTLLGLAGTHWTAPDTVWASGSGKRMVKYENAGEILYLTLEMDNTPNGVVSYFYSTTSSYWIRAHGIRVIFSQSWDFINHVQPISAQQSFIGFNQRFTVSPSPAEEAYIYDDLTTSLIQYWLWVEDNGFALVGIPESNTRATEQGAFIAIVERNPNKEYTDGFTNFFGYFRVSNMEPNMPRSNPAYNGLRLETFMRPFAYVAHTEKDYVATPNTEFKTIYSEINTSWDGTTLGHIYNPNGIEFSKLAIKSEGNGKVYYVKPIIHNSISVTTFEHETGFSPIFQSELFFAWRPDAGLVGGDIVSLPSSTIQYLCLNARSCQKTIVAPVDAGTPTLYYAIKYHE